MYDFGKAKVDANFGIKDVFAIFGDQSLPNELNVIQSSNQWTKMWFQIN